MDTVAKATMQFEQAGGLPRKGGSGGPDLQRPRAQADPAAVRSRITEAVARKVCVLFERTRDARATAAEQISNLIAIAGTQGETRFPAERRLCVICRR